MAAQPPVRHAWVPDTLMFNDASVLPQNHKPADGPARQRSKYPSRITFMMTTIVMPFKFLNGAWLGMNA